MPKTGYSIPGVDSPRQRQGTSIDLLDTLTNVPQDNFGLLWPQSHIAVPLTSEVSICNSFLSLQNTLKDVCLLCVLGLQPGKCHGESKRNVGRQCVRCCGWAVAVKRWLLSVDSLNSSPASQKLVSLPQSI